MISKTNDAGTRSLRSPPAGPLLPALQQEGIGGGGRDRTDDLMLAKHALSQLSYAPFGIGQSTPEGAHGGPGKT